MAALDQPAKQVQVPGIPWGHDAVRAQHTLRGRPGLIGNDARDRPGDRLPIAILASLSEQVLAHIGSAGDDVPHMGCTPERGGPATAFSWLGNLNYGRLINGDMR